MENYVVGVLKSIACMCEGDESLNKTTTYVFTFRFLSLFSFLQEKT